MSCLEEIDKKLRANKEERKRLVADKKLCLAMNKVKVDGKSPEAYLTADDRQLIPAQAKRWLPEKYVQPVLSACTSYRYCCEKITEVDRLREDNLNRFRQGSKRGRGRPPGGNICAKALINELALIWLDAFGKLPKKGDKSRFGRFVEDIATGLKEPARPGIVNEVLREKNHARYREALSKGLPVLPFRETFLEAKEEDWLERQEERAASSRKAVVRAALAVIEKQRVEAEIKKIRDSVKDEIVLKLIDP